VQRDRDDQEHQHARLGDRLVDDPVEQRPERGHRRERQRDLDDERRLQRCDEHEHAGDRQRRADPRGQARREPPPIALARGAHDLEEAGDDGHRREQARDARCLAELQSGERERAVGDELARRHPDHARDREHQHQREREQRVDRAVGDAVLRQQRGDRDVHRRMVSRRRDRRPPPRRR
jgi:hypothetical protein